MRKNQVIIPTIKRIGKAMYKKPAATSPIRINGKNTNVKKIFVIPQVALTAKISNLPNTAIINMRKNNVHIRTSSYLSYVSYPSVSYLWQLWMGLT